MIKLKFLAIASLIALGCMIDQSALASSPSDSARELEEDSSGSHRPLTTGNGIALPQELAGLPSEIFDDALTLHHFCNNLFNPSCDDSSEGSDSSEDRSERDIMLSLLNSLARIRIPGSWKDGCPRIYQYSDNPQNDFGIPGSKDDSPPQSPFNNRNGNGFAQGVGVKTSLPRTLIYWMEYEPEPELSPFG